MTDVAGDPPRTPPVAQPPFKPAAGSAKPAGQPAAESAGHSAADSAEQPAAGSAEHSAADSAGQSWAGRSFDHHPTTFAGDDGTAPQALIEALAGFRSLAVPKASVSRYERADAEAAVVDAVRDARLLVPLLAHAGETGIDEHGRTIDKTQELSIVTVQAPDGRTALPAFTSTEAMARWNPKARPIPTPARRVALAAAGEGTDLIILDPTSPTEFALRRPAVWAVAEAAPWLSPLVDPEIAAAFSFSVQDRAEVGALALWPGDPANRLAGPEVIVELALVPGLDQTRLDDLLAVLQRRWAQHPLVARSIDTLAVRLRQAENS